MSTRNLMPTLDRLTAAAGARLGQPRGVRLRIGR
jgi:hypothetical protein